MLEHPLDATRLEAALASIAHPDNWVQHDAAKLPDGRPTDYWNPGATAFCLVSAMYRADLRIHEENAVRRLVPGGCVGLWNDHRDRTHAEVLALGRKAVDRVLKDKAKADKRNAG